MTKGISRMKPAGLPGHITEAHGQSENGNTGLRLAAALKSADILAAAGNTETYGLPGYLEGSGLFPCPGKKGRGGIMRRK